MVGKVVAKTDGEHEGCSLCVVVGGAGGASAPLGALAGRRVPGAKTDKAGVGVWVRGDPTIIAEFPFEDMSRMTYSVFASLFQSCAPACM